MIGTTISIKNKLEVLAGGFINVPGCEPTSSLTSDTLSKNMHCNASVIPLQDVLRLIPGSKLVRAVYPSGTSSTGWFVELPSGPPGNGNICPTDCLTDWYKILKENAKERSTEEIQPQGACAGFNYSGCPRP